MGPESGWRRRDRSVDSTTPLPPAPAAPRPATMHPLEPLTAAEVRLAVSLLTAAGRVTPTTRFVSVSPLEPPKQRVHAGDWAGIDRRAFAVLFDNAANACYEATLSLTGRA